MARGQRKAAAQTAKRARPAAKRPRRRKTQLPPRQGWAFIEAAVAEDNEERRTRALEYIAHYLDRIELQLERIADSIEDEGAMMMLEEEE